MSTKKQLILSNGCTSSNPSVTPNNWVTGGKELLNRDWRIQYYFHDPLFKEKYPKGKQVRKKGMNEFHTLKERRNATKYILDRIQKQLIQEHYNPITDTFNSKYGNIDGYSFFYEALKHAYENLKVQHTSKLDYKSMLKYVEQSIVALSFTYIQIKDVSRKHIKQILTHQQTSRGLTNNRYNKYLSYLSVLFGDLIEEEIMENDPTYKIKKLPVTRSLREVINDDERVEISKFLKCNYYNFWRYMMIFFASGARSSELLRIKYSDVDLSKSEYKVLIKKGKQFKEVIKPINRNVLYLWKELMNDEGEYIFSRNLEPGENSITRAQVTRRWKVHVKDKLGITADFYSLKHLSLDEIVSSSSMKDASALASHTSDKMMKNHYAVGEKQRQLDRLKKVNISFLKEEIVEKRTKIAQMNVV